MYVASYRNTEAGARAIQARAAREKLAQQTLISRDDERRARRLAEEAAAEARAAMVRAERRAAGARFQRSFSQIEHLICKAYKVRRQELRSERRHKNVVKARQALCYWACRLTKLSLPQIGKLMSRDHTTVLSGKRVYVEKRKKDGRALREVR